MTRLIKALGKGNPKFIPPDEAMRQLEEFGERQDERMAKYYASLRDQEQQPAPAQTIDEKVEEQLPPQVPPRGKDDLFIGEDTQGAYWMHNVPYRGERYHVEWDKAVFSPANLLSPDKRQHWIIPSAPLYAATLVELYKHKTCQDQQQRELAEEMWNMFIDSFKENWFGTSTYVHRKMLRKDIIIHDKGQETEWRTNENFAVVDHFGGFSIMKHPVTEIMAPIYQPQIDAAVQALFESDTETLQNAFTMSKDSVPFLEISSRKGIVAFKVLQTLSGDCDLRITAGYTGKYSLRYARVSFMDEAWL